MNFAVLKTTILSIILMGIVILLSGILLLFYRQQIAPYMRYLLPIPSIGVASYVFVYNMFSKYDGHRPGSIFHTFMEICWASGISSVFFCFYPDPGVYGGYEQIKQTANTLMITKSA